MKNKVIDCERCSNYDCKKIAESGGFRFWGCLIKFVFNNYRPKNLMRELVCEAKVFVPEYSFVWRGGQCLCKAPYGEYIWHFAVQMKQEQLWNYREFQEGYEYGSAPQKHTRDANPYQEPSRDASWDCGYILGLEKLKGL